MYADNSKCCQGSEATGRENSHLFFIEMENGRGLGKQAGVFLTRSVFINPVIMFPGVYPKALEQVVPEALFILPKAGCKQVVFQLVNGSMNQVITQKKKMDYHSALKRNELLSHGNS